MAMELTIQMHSLSQLLPFHLSSPTSLAAPFGAKYSPKFYGKLRNETRLVHNAMLAQNDAVIAAGEDLPDDYANWIPHRADTDRRRAGILLHPTSFPGPYGIGDLGSQAFRFLDWLHHSGCSLWQVSFQLIISIFFSPGKLVLKIWNMHRLFELPGFVSHGWCVIKYYVILIINGVFTLYSLVDFDTQIFLKCWLLEAELESSALCMHFGIIYIYLKEIFYMFFIHQLTWNISNVEVLVLTQKILIGEKNWGKV